jgi:hypothetical protein
MAVIFPRRSLEGEIWLLEPLGHSFAVVHGHIPSSLRVIHSAHETGRCDNDSATGDSELSSSIPVHQEQDHPQKEESMAYVLLIYQGTTPTPTSTEAWATLGKDEQKSVYAEYAALNKTPGVTPGLPLGLPANATTVRVQDGKTLTTEGPFVDSKEALGGYYVLEAGDLDAAIELASRIPAARLGGAVEIRPSAKYW